MCTRSGLIKQRLNYFATAFCWLVIHSVPKHTQKSNKDPMIIATFCVCVCMQSAERVFRSICFAYFATHSQDLYECYVLGLSRQTKPMLLIPNRQLIDSSHTHKHSTFRCSPLFRVWLRNSIDDFSSLLGCAQKHITSQSQIIQR